MTGKDKELDEEAFKLVLEVFRDYYKGLIDFSFKNSVILIAILGWIISSDKAWIFFGRSESIRHLASAVAVTYTIIHAYWVWKWYVKSNLAYAHLEEIRYINPKYFDSQRVHPYMAVLFAAMHALVILLIVMFVYYTPNLLDLSGGR